MSKIVKLEKKDYQEVLPLFQDIPYGWDVFFNKIQEGYGFILADNSTNPNVALAFLSGCIIYGGNPKYESAKDLIHYLEFQPLILPVTEAWGNLIKDVQADKVKTNSRYYFPFSSLDQKILYSIELDTSNDFRLVKIEEQHAEKLKEELGEEYHIYHFSSFKEFVNKGCGYCIVKGDEICAATIAAVRSKNQIQIQVNTKEKYRHMGLATKTSAALLRYCLENEINADWDAANPISRKLAMKLGYKQSIPYHVLSILP